MERTDYTRNSSLDIWGAEKLAVVGVDKYSDKAGYFGVSTLEARNADRFLAAHLKALCDELDTTMTDEERQTKIEVDGKTYTRAEILEMISVSAVRYLQSDNDAVTDTMTSRLHLLAATYPYLFRPDMDKKKVG